jgi:hypothetical protein
MHHSHGVATMGDVRRIRENGREEGMMELKWMAVGALALVPCVAMAQSKTARDSSTTHRDSSQQTTSPTRRDSSQKTTTSTSTGDVSGAAGGSSVTQAMTAAQNNANMIGTPAWWKSHGTADGKPLSAKTTPTSH